MYSVNGVIGEIKDANTRASLQVLPYEFKFKEPSHEAAKFSIDNFSEFISCIPIYKLFLLTIFQVGNFSRKTGDYSNLSAVDLQLLALTYQLCKENLSSEEFSKLKVEPVKPDVIEILNSYGI